MLKPACACLLIVLIICAAPSCKKTTENELINGLWSLTEVYLDTMTTNYLTTLPEFNNGHNCCFYKLDFKDNGEVNGFYVTNDSINFVTLGNWSLPDYNKVNIKLDRFIDGVFTIKKPSLTHWELTSDSNHIKLYDNGVNPKFDTAYTRMEMYSI